MYSYLLFLYTFSRYITSFWDIFSSKSSFINLTFSQFIKILEVCNSLISPSSFNIFFPLVVFIHLLRIILLLAKLLHIERVDESQSIIKNSVYPFQYLGSNLIL
ncbi:hypothetical protein HOA93_04335 [bacterium]|nr:hypothetical protein [bacterium]